LIELKTPTVHVTLAKAADQAKSGSYRAEIAADSEKPLTQSRLNSQAGRLHQQPRVRGLSDQIAVLNG
jgi:hypothetical protein